MGLTACRSRDLSVQSINVDVYDTTDFYYIFFLKIMASNEKYSGRGYTMLMLSKQKQKQEDALHEGDYIY